MNERFDFGNGGPHSTQYWDFYRDGVSPSCINSFFQDREAFRLHYVEGWESGYYSFAMEWGNIFHWLHERWINKHKQDILEYAKRWLHEREITTPEVRQQQALGYAMAEAMWPVYKKLYAADRKHKWISTEDHFEVWYELPNGKNLRLHGFMDGVYVDKSKKIKTKNKNVLHDMKTSSRIDGTRISEIEEATHLDMQMMLYMLVCRMQGNPVEHVEWDLIRRPGIKKRDNETFTQYKKRLRKEVEKDKDHYFKRWTVPVPIDVQKEWEFRIFVPAMLDMSDWSEGKMRHYPRPGGLVTRYGKVDMYQPIVRRDFTGMKRRRPSSRAKGK